MMYTRMHICQGGHPHGREKRKKHILLKKIEKLTEKKGKHRGEGVIEMEAQHGECEIVHILRLHPPPKKILYTAKINYNTSSTLAESR